MEDGIPKEMLQLSKELEKHISEIYPSYSIQYTPSRISVKNEGKVVFGIKPQKNQVKLFFKNAYKLFSGSEYAAVLNKNATTDWKNIALKKGNIDDRVFKKKLKGSKVDVFIGHINTVDMKPRKECYPKNLKVLVLDGSFIDQEMKLFYQLRQRTIQMIKRGEYSVLILLRII
jgi:hypothetical protein